MSNKGYYFDFDNYEYILYELEQHSIIDNVNDINGNDMNGNDMNGNDMNGNDDNYNDDLYFIKIYEKKNILYKGINPIKKEIWIWIIHN